MAKQIEAGKFLVIECTAGELMDAVGSDICICDWCDRPCLPSDKGCYIAVPIIGTVRSAMKSGLPAPNGIPKMPMWSVGISTSTPLVSESNVSKC